MTDRCNAAGPTRVGLDLCLGDVGHSGDHWSATKKWPQHWGDQGGVPFEEYRWWFCDVHDQRFRGDGLAKVACGRQDGSLDDRCSIHDVTEVRARLAEPVLRSFIDLADDQPGSFRLGQEFMSADPDGWQRNRIAFRMEVPGYGPPPGPTPVLGPRLRLRRAIVGLRERLAVRIAPWLDPLEDDRW